MTTVHRKVWHYPMVGRPAPLDGGALVSDRGWFQTNKETSGSPQALR
jgi:hypothetical protein